MGSFSGLLQRPLVAVAAAAIASVSADISDKLRPPRSSDPTLFTELSNTKSPNSVKESAPWISNLSVSKLTSLSFATKVQIPLPNINHPLLHSCHSSTWGLLSNSHSSSVSSAPALLTLYHSAKLAKAPKPIKFKHFTPSLPPEVLYRWHLPESYDLRDSDCSSSKSRTVVVLLGWLGAKQKHLKRYADWYTSRGFHAITFTFPMAEILSYQAGGKVEQDIELLVNHLADWLEEEHGKNLVFHTFSNTGWLTYGVILEKFQKQDPALMGRIRGCVVDSAPVAAPDPQVWASGFSAAFLKKQSIATRGLSRSKESGAEALVDTKTSIETKPAATETALLTVLEKFFKVVLNLPTVNRLSAFS
uniref:Transmembrane protein 53 n=1 Tax=Nelumbo nucifera TaxID=4432 RepID=A0A822YV20_NELNU|nr:TPA_asm: hypothetical protein HUJ06_006583 [Nelumbo nucifera]